MNGPTHTEPTLEGPLLRWRTLEFPTDWDEVFGASGPLHLEVGFGDGRYTARRALENPHERFVALEISATSVLRAVRRMRRDGVTNVRLLKVGAQFAVRHLFGPHQLATVTVNFPDPWPKERHAGNRLLQRRFFELAAARLRPGGAVLLATDHPEYLEFARSEARASGLFRLEEAEPPAAVFETKYALKWKSQGKPLYYQPFVYTGHPAPEFPPFERPREMPHALLTGTPPTELQLDKRVVQYGEGHVILHEAARSTAQDLRWLVRVTADEPDLKQQLLVVVERRQTGDLIVRILPFGDPLITPTVRGAVHAVTEWLLEQPGLRLLERNY